MSPFLESRQAPWYLGQRKQQKWSFRPQPEKADRFPFFFLGTLLEASCSIGDLTILRPPHCEKPKACEETLLEDDIPCREEDGLKSTKAPNMWVEKPPCMWDPLAPAAPGNTTWIGDKLNCWAFLVFLAHKIVRKNKIVWSNLCYTTVDNQNNSNHRTPMIRCIHLFRGILFIHFTFWYKCEKWTLYWSLNIWVVVFFCIIKAYVHHFLENILIQAF